MDAGALSTHGAVAPVCADAPLVRRTDDEHPHVMAMGCRDRRFIVLTDEIPMQVHVIETVRLDRIDDQLGLAMGGEPHMTNTPLRLPTADDVQTSTGANGLFEMVMTVDAMNGQQINPLHLQAFQR